MTFCERLIASQDPEHLTNLIGLSLGADSEVTEMIQVQSGYFGTN